MAGRLAHQYGLVLHSCTLVVKSVEEDGTFTGYASVFSKDSDGDVIMKGAFQRTIKNKGGKVPILWQHDKTEPIGVNIEMKEDDYGLLIKGQLNMEVQRAREARSLIKQGAIDGLSIGFYITQRPEIKDGVRYIKEVNLMEYSVVTFPANEDARAGNMKGGKVPMAGKAGSTDFQTVLAQQQAESDLWDERYQAMNALSECVHNIVGDNDDDDVAVDKKTALEEIQKAYQAYGSTMVAWWDKYIDVMVPDAKAAGDPLQKASAKVATKMKRIADMHHSAMNASQTAQNNHRKALDMVNQMVYSHLIGADINAPNPQPKSNPPLPLHQDEHLPDQKGLADLQGSLLSLVFK